MSGPKMTKARKLAKGQPCQIRVPGDCNGNPETTVLSHYSLPGYKGVGMKVPDAMGAHGCSDCHDVVDFRRKPKMGFSRVEIRLMHAEGVMRTQHAIREMGR